MTCDQITAVVLTKGDRDISEVLDSWLGKFKGGHVIEVGDPDRMVYARYVGARQSPCEVVALQDDDVLVDWTALAALYQPGKIVCNMPEEFRHGPYRPDGISLVGFGCIADRAFFDYPFRAYDAAGLPRDEVFLRECDRVFTAAHSDHVVWVDVPIKRLECSWGSDRMWKQNRARSDFEEIKRRISLLALAKTNYAINRRHLEGAN